MVMVDTDLARLYEVETKALNRAVRRNLERFPEEFMFQLTAEETSSLVFHLDKSNLRYQIGTSSKEKAWGGRRYLPYVFTEQGEGHFARRKICAVHSARHAQLRKEWGFFSFALRMRGLTRSRSICLSRYAALGCHRATRQMLFKSLQI